MHRKFYVFYLNVWKWRCEAFSSLLAGPRSSRRLAGVNVKQGTAQRGRRGRFLDPSSACESEKKQRLKLERDRAAETLREEVQTNTHLKTLSGTFRSVSCVCSGPDICLSLMCFLGFCVLQFELFPSWTSTPASVSLVSPAPSCFFTWASPPAAHSLISVVCAEVHSSVQTLSPVSCSVCFLFLWSAASSTWVHLLCCVTKINRNKATQVYRCTCESTTLSCCPAAAQLISYVLKVATQAFNWSSCFHTLPRTSWFHTGLTGSSLRLFNSLRDRNESVCSFTKSTWCGDGSSTWGSLSVGYLCSDDDKTSTGQRGNSCSLSIDYRER